MKRIAIIIIASVFALQGYSQQINTYSQYMQDKYAVNPAVAGSSLYSPLNFSYKQFWTGINDAPSMQTLSGHVRIYDEVGIGGKVFNYSAGPIGKTGIEGTYAYNLALNNTLKLSFGLSAMLYQYKIDKEKLKLENPNDATIDYSSNNLIVPDAAFGIYLYDRNYYAGISTFQLFNRRVDLKNEANLDQKQVRHYYLIGGYDFKINKDYSVEPSLLAKFIEAGQYQVDINVKGAYRISNSQKLWLGASYRTSDAIAIMVGLSQEKIGIGYAYDITLSDINTHSNGSHELVITYNFSSSRPKL